jgi:hypothetical protein
LFKDYITFYKYQDEKTPKDFLLLKEFSVVSSGRKNGFIIVDKSKQLEHEFYAESAEDYLYWYQALNELKIKNQTGELVSSSSTMSGYDLNAMTRDETANMPVSTNLNRRNNNNLQLHLSTILDSNDDQVVQSPTLVRNSQQPQYGSSRESSRDSSPVLNYRKSNFLSRIITKTGKIISLRSLFINCVLSYVFFNFFPFDNY